MIRTMNQITVSAIALALGCATAISGCDEGVGESDDALGADRNGTLLFDLELDEVLLLHAEYTPDTDVETFVEAYTAPFDCDAFGNICEEMGESGAIDFMRQTTELGLTGASETEMQALADTLSDALAAAAPSDDPVEGGESDDAFRAFGNSFAHFQYFDGIRTKLTYGRTKPLLSRAYAWGKLIQQQPGGIGWTKIPEPFRLYLELRSVHHHQNSGVGGSAHSDSQVRISKKNEGTFNSAGTDGQIYFKQFYDTPISGWGWTAQPHFDIHNWIFTRACSRGWSSSGSSSAHQCWTDSPSHF